MDPQAVAVQIIDGAVPPNPAAPAPAAADGAAGAPGPSASDSGELTSVVPIAPEVGKAPLSMVPMGGEGEDDDDDDDEDGPPRKKRGGHGRRKIEIEYIEDKIRRHITFSKRKAGISKKAYELSRLTGAQVGRRPPAGPSPGARAFPSAPPTRPYRPLFTTPQLN